jgi:hypothetical protein
LQQSEEDNMRCGSMTIVSLLLLLWSGYLQGEEFHWGVNGHPGVQEGYRHVPISVQLDLVAELGARWYRCDWSEAAFRGNRVVLEQMVADASRSGIRILPVIFPAKSCRDDLPPCEIRVAAYEFGRAIASHFRGKITHWELDNELDNFTLVRKGEKCPSGNVWQFGDPTGDSVDHFENGRYERARAELEGLHAGIKAGDPSAKTLVDFCWIHYGFIELLLARDLVAIDILASHWYSDMGGIHQVRGNLNHCEHLNRYGRPIWFTEVNWKGGSRGGKEDEQANYLQEIARQLRSSPSVEAMFVYELFDEPYFGPENDESFYGLIELIKGADGHWQAGRRKPAFSRLQGVFGANPLEAGRMRPH